MRPCSLVLRTASSLAHVWEANRTMLILPSSKKGHIADSQNDVTKQPAGAAPTGLHLINPPWEDRKVAQTTCTHTENTIIGTSEKYSTCTKFHHRSYSHTLQQKSLQPQKKELIILLFIFHFQIKNKLLSRKPENNNSDSPSGSYTFDVKHRGGGLQWTVQVNVRLEILILKTCILISQEIKSKSLDCHPGGGIL